MWHFSCTGQPVASRAHVKAVYEHDDGTELQFMRMVTGSTSEYFINSIACSSDHYLQKLEALGINVKAKNFLVFQGAVETIAMKNPKERTLLFEEISRSGKVRSFRSY